MVFGLYHSLYEWFHPLYLEDKQNGFTTQRFPNVCDIHLSDIREKKEFVYIDENTSRVIRNS
jgi:hypothetical protein